MRADEKLRLEAVLRAAHDRLQASITSHADAAENALHDPEGAASTVPVEAALMAKAREDLLRVERNLADLESPDFGLCEACDQPIPLQRLILLPAARLCVHCAARSEHDLL